MPRSRPVDGFALEYDRTGSGPPVVLLHGWPGDRTDYHRVVPLLEGADAVVCDLRGFGASDKHAQPPGEAYSLAAQARSVLGLIDELGLDPVVLGGYDIGSRIAQEIARAAPGRVRAMVLSPPMPGAGERILGPSAAGEFWYQHFHRLDLAEALVDGDPGAVRAYLGHFWSHWAGPAAERTPAEVDHLVAAYSAPGAFVASIAWYRAGAGSVARAMAERPPAPAERLATPVDVLWPDHDPLFPFEWSDRLGEFFADFTLERLDAGHYTPLEAPEAFARRLLGRL